MTKASEYCHTLAEVLEKTQVTDAQGVAMVLDLGAQRAADRLLQAQAAGRKVMVVGNGGSAAIASHMVNDLSKAVGVKALNFTDPSLLTALTNDEGYENAYARQVTQWAQADDLLIAISSSGRSPNILNAVTAAHQTGCFALTLSGFAPHNPLRRMGGLNFYVPHDRYGFVELAHSVLTHLWTDAAAAALSQTQTSTQEVAYGIKFPTIAGVSNRRSGLRRHSASA